MSLIKIPWRYNPKAIDFIPRSRKPSQLPLCTKREENSICETQGSKECKTLCPFCVSGLNPMQTMLSRSDSLTGGLQRLQTSLGGLTIQGSRFMARRLGCHKDTYILTNNIAFVGVPSCIYNDTPSQNPEILSEAFWHLCHTRIFSVMIIKHRALIMEPCKL